MAKVVFTEFFVKELKKKFSEQEGNKILDLLESLEENPHKGKELTTVGKAVIKEIKYGNYRFYFVTDGYKIKVLKISELHDLMIKFVRMSRTSVLDHDQKSSISDMSNKKDQQKTIDEIKRVLTLLGEEGF